MVQSEFTGYLGRCWGCPGPGRSPGRYPGRVQGTQKRYRVRKAAIGYAEKVQGTQGCYRVRGKSSRPGHPVPAASVGDGKPSGPSTP